MAVDTRDRRFSMIGIAMPVPSMLPNPDGTIGTQDRAMLLWLYAGIALSIGGLALPIISTQGIHSLVMGGLIVSG